MSTELSQHERDMVTWNRRIDAGAQTLRGAVSAAQVGQFLTDRVLVDLVLKAAFAVKPVGAAEAIDGCPA